MKRWPYAKRAAFMRALSAPALRVDVEGAQHVPPSGPLIVAANHRRRRLDPLVLGLASPRPPAFVSAVDLRRSVLARVAGLAVDIVYVTPEIAALGRFQQRCERLLAGGSALVIFPEGAAMGDGEGPFRHGVAYLALRGPVPVTPVWIDRPGRRRFRVRFGPALRPRAAALNRGSLVQLTREVQAAILALAVPAPLTEVRCDT